MKRGKSVIWKEKHPAKHKVALWVSHNQSSSHHSTYTGCSYQNYVPDMSPMKGLETGCLWHEAYILQLQWEKEYLDRKQSEPQGSLNCTHMHNLQMPSSASYTKLVQWADDLQHKSNLIHVPQVHSTTYYQFLHTAQYSAPDPAKSW